MDLSLDVLDQQKFLQQDDFLLLDDFHVVGWAEVVDAITEH